MSSSGRRPLSRRTMIKRALGAGAALALAPFSTMGAPAAEEIRTRPIPSSGEALPCVGLGTWQQFDVGPNEAEKRASLKEVLRRLVNLGASVVDSSPMYGRAEQVVGELSAELDLSDDIF